MKITFVAVAAVLSITLPSALAGHCGGWSTSAHDIGAGGIYFDNDLCQPDCIVSAWIYQESNGIPGLQRADVQVDNTCHGMIDPDRRIL